MADPVTIQSLDRTVHCGNSGIDIERKFYIEPYSSHTTFLKELMGWAEVKDLATVRHPPARDPWIPNCYCSDARAVFYDPRVMTSGGNLAGTKKNPNNTIRKKVQIKEKPADGTAGALVIAHYRPLITALAGSWEDEGQQENTKHPEFDWMDYESLPGVRQMPWPEGLYIMHKGNACHVPDTIGFPFTVPITTITIRRMFVAEIPWEVIDGAAGCVNHLEWPANDAGVNGRIPVSPPRTCKFENARVINMMDTEGNRWHEIVYTFTRINLYSKSLMAANGDDNPGPVTWNHLFTRPSLWGWHGATAWYECFKGKARPIWDGPFGIDQPGAAVFDGRLHQECDFAELFKL